MNVSIDRDSIRRAVLENLQDPSMSGLDPSSVDQDGFEAMQESRGLVARLMQMSKEEYEALPEDQKNAIQQQLLENGQRIEESRSRAEEAEIERLQQAFEQMLPQVDYEPPIQLPDPSNREQLLSLLHPHWRELALEEAGKPEGEVVAGHPPGQGVVDWHEETINQTVDYGRATGAVNDEIHNDLARSAFAMLGVTGESHEALAAQPPKEFDPRMLAELLKPRFARTENLERQFLGFVSYVEGAKNASDQIIRIVKGAESLQTIERAGTPPVSHRQMIEELWTRHDIPGHALRYSTRELRQKYDDIALAQVIPGHHEIGLGSRRTFKVESNELGVTTHKELHKKSGWSVFKDKVLKIAGPVFTVMSFMWFCPPVAIVGAIGSAAIGAYQAYKNKDWLGVALSIAGGVAGAAGAAYRGAIGAAQKASTGAAQLSAKALEGGAKFAGIAAKTLRNVESWARVVQGAGSAYRSAEQGNWKGAIAGVGAAVAGYGATTMGEAANWVEKAGTWLDRGSAALDTWASAKQGDYFGAFASAAGIARSLNVTGPGADQWLTRLAGGAKGADLVDRAIRSGDYFGAAAGLTQIAASSKLDAEGKGGERIQHAAAGLHGLGMAQRAIEAGEYGQAAAALAHAAGSFQWISDDRNARRSDEEPVEGQTSPDGVGPVLPEDIRYANEMASSTSTRLFQASALFQQLDTAHKWIERGEYARAATEIAKIRQVYPNAKLPKGLDRAITVFQHADVLEHSLETRNYTDAAATVLAIASTMSKTDKRRAELLHYADMMSRLTLARQAMNSQDHRVLLELVQHLSVDATRAGGDEAFAMHVAQRQSLQEASRKPRNLKELAVVLHGGDLRSAASATDLLKQLAQPALPRLLDALADTRLHLFSGSHERAAQSALRAAAQLDVQTQLGKYLAHWARELEEASRTGSASAIDQASTNIDQALQAASQELAQFILEAARRAS